MSWINIARVGRFKDMAGREADITPALLEGIVKTYDPARRPAPLVFGHPTLNGPAFGWVEGLRVVGNVLQAKFRDVPEQVKNLVAAGHYRQVSMSLWPKGGLRHVGLLGATPPAIDGLGEVSFGADPSQTFEFSTEPEGSREESMNLEEAKKKIEELEGQNEQLATERDKAIQERDKATSDFAAFKGEQEAKAREARFDKLVADGKALPGEREQVLSFAATLGQAGKTINFAAEGGKAEQVSQEEAYWRGLEARQPHGLFTEFATAERAAPGGDKSLDIPADLTSRV